MNEKRVEERIQCDAIGCTESHPVDHDCLGEPGFAVGRWLGWVYLDLNRPDLCWRPLRFCSIECMIDYGEMTTRRSQLTPRRYKLDDLLQDTGPDDLSQQRAVRQIRANHPRP